MRVLVVGGTGFVGSRAADLIARIGDVSVAIAGRAPDIPGAFRLDLRDPATFESMRTFDVVVNCSDGVAASPIAAARWCLEHGPVFLETSAEPGTVLSLHRALASEVPAVPHRGAVVLGVGLFPGLSNLLARALHDWVRDCRRLEVAVRLSPLSGAGAGMCATMARMLVTDAPVARGGLLTAVDPVSAGFDVDFPGGRAATMATALAEPAMLHWSLRVPDTAGYVATRPSLPSPMLRATGAVMRGGPGRRRVLERLTRTGMYAMRGVLLRGRATTVELVAIANRDPADRSRERTLSLSVSDGVGATALAVAAVVELLASGLVVPPGVRTIDQVTTLADVLREMRLLSDGTVAISEPVSPIRLAS